MPRKCPRANPPPTMTPHEPGAGADSDPDATQHVLWPLVLILGEIAERIARRQAEERAPESDDEAAPNAD